MIYTCRTTYNLIQLKIATTEDQGFQYHTGPFGECSSFIASVQICIISQRPQSDFLGQRDSPRRNLSSSPFRRPARTQAAIDLPLHIGLPGSISPGAGRRPSTARPRGRSSLAIESGTSSSRSAGPMIRGSGSEVADQRWGDVC